MKMSVILTPTQSLSALTPLWGSHLGLRSAVFITEETMTLSNDPSILEAHKV